jgi:hypothetical protein
MDNPVQVERSTGLGNLLNRNCVAVQQRKFIFAVNVLNCYAVRVGYGVTYPRAALRLHGVIHVKVLRTWESQAKNVTYRKRLHLFFARTFKIQCRIR